MHLGHPLEWYLFFGCQAVGGSRRLIASRRISCMTCRRRALARKKVYEHAGETIFDFSQPPTFLPSFCGLKETGVMLQSACIKWAARNKTVVKFVQDCRRGMRGETRATYVTMPHRILVGVLGELGFLRQGRIRAPKFRRLVQLRC